MLKITQNGEPEISLKFMAYAKTRSPLSRIILRITRWLRAVNAEKYMSPAKCHLDIGCGDGYFLRRSQCDERVGLDRLLGNEVKDKLDFPDSYFDYVTMLAVIEHLERPQDIIKEVYRILKPDGRLIITTPKKKGEWLMRLVKKDITEIHKMYFNLESIRRLTNNMFDLILYKEFLLGLNQLFVMRKIGY